MTKTEKPANDDAPVRKAYTPPQLRRWGSLRQLTRGTDGMKQEPSAPGTRSRL